MLDTHHSIFYIVDTLLRSIFIKILGIVCFMKLSKVLTITGLTLIIVGAIIIFIPITQELWVSKSDILVSKTVSLPPMWKKELLLTYPFSSEPENYKDLVVKGYVESVDGLPFNLVIGNAKTYVTAKKVIKYEFVFSPTPTELKKGLKLKLLNVASTQVTEDFITEAITISEWEYYDYTFATPLFLPPKEVPVRIEGRASESEGYKFNIYIVDKKNFERLIAGVPFRAYYVGKNASSYKFKFTVPASKCSESLYFVVVRVPILELKTEKLLKTTVIVYTWMDYDYWFTMPLWEPPAKGDVIVEGKAEESKGIPFNLYFLDEENFERFRAGLPFKAYWKGEGKSSYTFRFTIPAEKSTESLYYVVERATDSTEELKVHISAIEKHYEEVMPKLSIMLETTKSYSKPIGIDVRVYAEASWKEKTYTHVLDNLPVGGAITVFGILLLIGAVTSKYVFSQTQ